MGAGLWICEQQADSGSPNVKSNKYSSFLPVALETGAVKCWHTWFEFSFCQGAHWQVQPAGSLRVVQLPQLWTRLQQRWRSKLSTSNKSVNRWGKNKHRSLQRPFGPTYADISMSRVPAYIGLRGTSSLVLCVEMESTYLNTGLLYCVQLMGHSCNSSCCCV